ncbi:MAG: TIM barrel protein [Candidatus Aminicenantes bacterium]|nr:TIM barrel protein [Candidatus Aminicenantes bacterium]NLH78000.1 TIM barrel protein [Acidobacteriota bacterium]
MATAPRGLRFGTAGVPFSSADDSSLAGIARIRELGLDALELEFVQGVKMGLDTAAKVREAARAADVRLSVHAPYFINLNSADPGKRLASQERLLKTARVGEACGAASVVFHAAFYGADAPEKAYAAVKEELRTLMSVVRAERLSIALRVETMGKRSQFGSLDEVLGLCREVDGLKPCLDFSHLFAREGKINGYDEFHRVWAKVARKLGPRALRDVHVHIAGIQYGDKGEIRHLNLEETEFRTEEWLQVLRDLGVEGTIICESPNLEGDAVLLKKLYGAQRAR